MAARHRLARLTLCFATLLGCAWPALAQQRDDTRPPAGAPTLQRVDPPLGQPGEEGLQMVFSPDGSRFARAWHGGVALWRTQPLERLGELTDPPVPPQYVSPKWGYKLNTYDSLRFDTDGWLHYVAESTHAWWTPDLQRGTGTRVGGLSADGRYALRSGTVGVGGVGLRGQIIPPGIPPQYYGANSDVYDLREQRSLCQLPNPSSADRMAVGGHWFAIQQSPAGPSNPRPLLVCNLATGQVFVMPFGKAHGLEPTIDPQGRWMAVSATSRNFFGGYRTETHLYALPLRPEEFPVRPPPDHVCGFLPCGEPKPMSIPESPPSGTAPSPDGRWLIGPKSGSGSLAFFDTASMKTVTVMHLAPPALNALSPLVFSRDGHWMAVQAGERLYRIDLRADKPEPTEVRPDTVPFQLQDIHNDGVHWLMHYRAEPGARHWTSALWRLNNQ